MKKFLLLAALVAAFVGNAQELQLTKAWEVGAPVLANTRQGIGLDGKYLINNKVEGIVYQYTEENVSNFGTTGATAAWPAIAKDDAGNVIVRVDNSWPGNFLADTTVFKIFPAGGGEPVDVVANIFADFEAENGRMDYLGHAEGNLMEEGAIYIVTAKSTGILRVPFVEGEIDGDHINLISVEGAANFANTGAYVDAWDAADGTKHYLLHWRGIVPYDMTLNEDMDLFTATAINTVDRANLTGYKCFARDGKNYIAYSLKPADRNYGDGFAIMEIGGEAPVFQVEDTGKDLNNGGICTQWFDIDGDYLFQYAGNQYIACYQFAGGEEEHTYAVCGSPAVLFGMENAWDPAAAPEMTLNEETGLYEWTSAETELGAGVIEFKVVQDHAWDVCFPENNYVVPVEGAGAYTLYVTYNPENNEVTAELAGEPYPVERKVYIIGEVNGNSWATNVGVEMDTEDGVVYTQDVVLQRPDKDDPQYCYFSFATQLMEAADDWNGLAPFRFGAVSEATAENPNGDFLFLPEMNGQPLQLTFTNGHAFQVPEGEYSLTVNMDDMTLTIVDKTTAIENINTDVKADNAWYNLQGVKFNGIPSVPGIYINNGKKVIVK